MKVIILCGGIGTRMKEETEFKPKPMVTVGNKPILWHIMKLYAHWGFNEFILALGYKSEYIKDYFLDQKAFIHDFTLNTKTFKKTFHLENQQNNDDFTITFVDTGQETLIGERILRCSNYIPDSDREFMVTYGDGVSDINIPTLLKFHHKQKTIGTITGVHPHSKYGLMKVNKDNLISKFVEKPRLTDWVNGGFMIFNRQFFKYLRPNEMEHPGLQRLSAQKQLSMYKHDGFWYAIDTYREYEELNKIWTSGDAPWKLW